MHGYYWRVTDQVWALQRPTQSNGIYEDFITPVFVDPLKNHLFARSSVALIGLPRDQSTDAHPSGYPWWQMAGRYYLKQQYPENPDIWHSLSAPLPGPNHGPNKWHYDEDIRSRPLFANFVGVDALFNMHTNAGLPSASGTRAYVAENRPYDLALANNVLCRMMELIHAQGTYENFKVEDQARVDPGYGENNRAEMPAMVLEVAFHTNASDAAALQDPVFVDAAMKGVEKGFRLQAEGKTCEPFEITGIPDVTIPRPGAITVPVNFQGFPFFPVTLTVEIVTCPVGTCNGGTVVYSEQQDSPFQFQFSCTGSTGTTDIYHWRSYLTDADGVKTNVVAHDLICTPTVGITAMGMPSAGVGPAH